LKVSAKKHGPEKRQVHICEQLGEFMARWCEEDMQMQKVDHIGLPFGPIVHYKGRRIGSFKKAWKTALRKAGIRRRIRSYDLRHTFVTNLVENGTELKTVSEKVGHTRPDTTLRLYHQVIPGRHKEAIKLVPRLQATDEPDRSTEQAEGNEGQKKGQQKNDS
jgi:integrase